MAHRTRPSRGMFPHQVEIWAIPTEATNLTGGAIQIAARTSVGVQCLVDDRPGRRKTYGGRDLETKPVRIAFCDPVVINQGDEIRWTTCGTTRVFQVHSFRSDLNLGRLWVAECEEQVDPNA